MEKSLSSPLCKTAYCSLHFIRRVSPVYTPFAIRKNLTLVRSKLCFVLSCGGLTLLTLLERVQRRATKFIANFDRTLGYKERLRACRIMMLYDMLFLFKSTSNFDIMDFISFSSSQTRCGSKGKLVCKPHRTNTTRHFYFSRMVCLRNSFLSFDLSYPLLLSRNFSWRNCGLNSILISILLFHVHFITPVPAFLVISLSTPIYNYIYYYFHFVQAAPVLGSDPHPFSPLFPCQCLLVHVCWI